MRKQALLQRMEGQRKELMAVLQEWHGPLSFVDRGLSLARYLKHPVVLAGMALVATIGQRGILAWVKRGWWLWKTLKRKT